LTERDQQLTAAGYRVIRVTARQLDHSPMAVIAAIAMALAR
jgi:very-short-patch-repair endonuclease